MLTIPRSDTMTKNTDDIAFSDFGQELLFTAIGSSADQSKLVRTTTFPVVEGH